MQSRRSPNGGHPLREPGGRPGGVWLVTVGLLGAAVGASLAAPPIAAAQLRMVLGRTLGAESVRADVVAWPPPALWWGKVDVLSVTIRHLRVGALEVDAFEATLSNMRFDPEALYVRRALVIRSLGSGIAHVTISQDALTHLLATQSAIRDAAVELRDGRVTLSATMLVLGAALRATGEGRLLLHGATRVDLVLDRLTVTGIRLPPALIDEVTGAMNPILDVRGLPFGLRLAGVRVDEGKVTLDAVAGVEGGE